MRTFVSILFLAALITPLLLSAQETSPKSGRNLTADTSRHDLQEVIISANVVFGNKQNTIQRSGSGYYLDSKELARFQHTDIARSLARVPGVNSFDEDGFGLRPNISLRGVSAERSAKITIMEDGVLIAPAPYSAPAAYYFPTAGRMSAMEILKGSSQIEYGPFTTGGAINMVSEPVTANRISSRLRGSYGLFGNRNAGLTLSQNFGQVAYLIEGFHYGSEGFKNLPSGGPTEFNKNDGVIKLRFSSKPTRKWQHQLEMKQQWSDEQAHETYLGLTEDDFRNDPFQRYAASANDLISTSHRQSQITHSIGKGNHFRITTTAYRNDFTRNWYKLDALSIQGAKTGIAAILNAPEQYSAELAILKGANSPVNALILKNNNRKYRSEGIQTKVDRHWNTGKIRHDVEFGIRLHTDQEDRFQWVDGYQMNAGTLLLNQVGIPGTDANRITSADAFAGYGLYKVKIGSKWTITPGLRYENIHIAQDDFGKNDTGRTGASLVSKSNQVGAWIPGVGGHYQPTAQLALFGGVHKGFSPPSVENGSLPESSINYELGGRWSKNAVYAELVGFFNDYSNLLGSDLAASGGSGSLQQFNAGEVNVGGIEALFQANLLNKRSQKWKMPLEFSYTFTWSEIKSNFKSVEEIWGTIEAGDQLPYLPAHQLFATLGLESGKWNGYLTGRYNGAFRTMAGKGEIPDNELVKAYLVTDISLKYALRSNLSINLTGLNIFNQWYAVARVPSGLRPGHPATISLGLDWRMSR